MTDTNYSNRKVSLTRRKADLLLSGWHNVCQGDEDLWVHPEFDALVPIEVAEQAQERMNRKAESRRYDI
jgi:hypothetical protein